MNAVLAACRTLCETAGIRGKVFVGFSGGLDSTVLLHALSGQPGLAAAGRLVALHVDHGLHADSTSWARHCQTVAQGLEVPFVGRELHLSVGPGLEARARAGRYRAFRELLGADDVLVLAHHLDDQLEAMLLHLLQGRGLFGMPRERVLGAGRLLRPLLALPRDALLGYARAVSLDWLDDPSNWDVALDRNFLRHQVLPPLRERFASLSERLQRVASQHEDTSRALVEVLGLERSPLPLSVFDGLSRAAAVSILRHWLVVHDAAAGVSDAALRDFLGQLQSSNDRQPRLVLRAGDLRRHRRQLYLVPEPPQLDDAYAVSLPGQLELPHGVLRLLRVDAPGRDAEADFQPQPPVAVDLVARGAVRVTFSDRLQPDDTLLRGGHRRRIGVLMREAGVPPWERPIRPVLVDEAGIVAVAGVAARDPAVGPATGADQPVYRCSWEPRRRR